MALLRSLEFVESDQVIAAEPGVIYVQIATPAQRDRLQSLLQSTTRLVVDRYAPRHLPALGGGVDLRLRWQSQDQTRAAAVSSSPREIGSG